MRIKGNHPYLKLSVIALMVFVLSYVFYRNYNPGNEVTKQEFVKWISKVKSAEIENKLQSKKKFGKISFDILYQPAELRVLRDLGSIQDPDFDNQVKEARKLEVYELRISNDEGSNILNTPSVKFESFDDKIKYFSFQLQERIKMRVGEVDLPCCLYHFERTFESTRFISILIAFNSEKITDTNQDRFIQIDDDFFGIGNINITINKEILNKTPRII